MAEKDNSDECRTCHGICSNTLKVSFGKHFFWRNPRATNTVDIGQRQPVHSSFKGNTPVGQNTTSARGEASALRYSGPPATVAGKNFIAVRPFASRNIISDAVVAPGKKTAPLSLADLSNPDTHRARQQNQLQPPELLASEVD